MSKLFLGKTFESSKTIDDEYVLQTAEWSGDHNPVHLSDAYAKETQFKKRIAHGLVCLGLVSNILGNSLQGAILIEQTVHYTAPVYIGDTITCKVVVKEIIPLKHRVKLEYGCFNQNGVSVTGGTVVLKYTDNK